MGLAVTVDQTSVAVTPGERATFRVVVHNTGTVVDEVQLAVLGNAAPWATVTPPALRLFPDQTEAAEVAVEPPRSAEAAAGLVPIGVLARSREQGETAVVELELHVGTFTHLDADIRPRRVTAGRVGEFTVFIDNFGNEDADIYVGADDPNEELDLSTRPDRITVAAGTASTVKVRARPVSRPFFGTPEDRVFDVMVAATDAPPLHMPGTLRVKPVMPRWVLPLVGVVAVLVAVVLVIRGQQEEVVSQARELRAQPTSFVPENPFTPTIAADPAAEAPPPPPETTEPPTATDPATTSTAPAEETTAPSAETTTTAEPAEPAEPQEAEVDTVVELDAGEPAVFAAERGEPSCDLRRYRRILASDPVRAQVLSDFLGVERQDLAARFSTWTPLLTTADAWVTDHDFVDGAFQPVPALMQAGTAVLVDAAGLPRIRCNGGTPLSVPSDSSFEPTVVGELWPALEEESPTVAVIRPHAEPVSAFATIVPELIGTFPVGTNGCVTDPDPDRAEVADGCFVRPAGTAGGRDRDATIADVLPGGAQETSTTTTTEPGEPAVPGALQPMTEGIYAYETATVSADGTASGEPVPRNLSVNLLDDGRIELTTTTGSPPVIVTEVFELGPAGLELVEAGVFDVDGADAEVADPALTPIDPPGLEVPASPVVGTTWLAPLSPFLAATYGIPIDDAGQVTVESEIQAVDSVAVAESGQQAEVYVVVRRFVGITGVPDRVELRSTTDWLLIRAETAIPDSNQRLVERLLTPPA